mmetsp:Transcript_42797/g.46467  ORF Transcript_42797/g.46467 Transcript_42797/m.46467 type:complete len:80 (-) Transcript_42797:10-249(-)
MMIQEILMLITTQMGPSSKINKVVESMSKTGQHVRDEVVEIINMPRYNATATQKSDEKTKLDSKVISQLRAPGLHHADC